MIQTKLSCDNKTGYTHRYDKQELEVSIAIAGHWWQIETNPGTVAISQPVTNEQIKPDAQHACCSDCAKSIVQKWANKNIMEVKSEENIPC